MRCLSPLLIAAALLATPAAALELGVQTHFAQGWQPRLLDDAAALGAESVRDGVPWARIEQTPGVYDFAPIRPWMARARAQGVTPLLTFWGTHPLYDEGHTPHSDAGRAAFARFVAATVAAFPDLTPRIEIGNETNAPNFISGPAAAAPAESFARLATAVRTQVKAVAPGTEILCTGAHSVALDYFRRLFTAGGLAACDAISLHPYRPQPEGLGPEITALRALMDAHGARRPIHATEFGKWFDDPAEAPDYMLKMATLMGVADIRAAWWYALLDEPWWPNMGLLDRTGQEKPAAPAFRLLSQTLLPLGAPRAIGATPSDRIYAFGPGPEAIVAWGAPGELTVTGATGYRDARGRPTAAVTRLSEAPVVILGQDLSVSVSRPAPIHDSLLGFGQPPWSYWAIPRDGPETELGLQETNWSPHLGNRYLSPLAVTAHAINGIVFDAAPMRAVERFTAPQAGRYRIAGRWAPAETKDGDDRGDGARLIVQGGGDVLADRVIRDAPVTLEPVTLRLEAGATVDFAIGPNDAPGGDVVTRRIRVAGPLP